MAHIIQSNPIDTTLSFHCPFCQSEHQHTFKTSVLIKGSKAYQSGALIQDAYPTLTPSEREYLKTGICDNCWSNL